jgi:MSHA pilin protein MshA
MSKATQRGFTLIELVVVIVILGILAAFALPKFMGLEKQARAASLKALEGSLRSSAAMAHSIWLANGSPATITIDGTPTPITITRGYPNLATIDDTIDASAIDTTTTPTGPAGKFRYAAGAGRFTLNGRSGTAATNCTVTYTVPATLGDSPTIVSDPTGC